MIINRLKEFVLGLRSAIAIYVEASKNETPSTGPMRACFDRLKELKKLILILERELRNEDNLVCLANPAADAKRIQELLGIAKYAFKEPFEQIDLPAGKNGDDFTTFLSGNKYGWEVFTRPTRPSGPSLLDEPSTTRLVTLQHRFADFEEWMATVLPQPTVHEPAFRFIRKGDFWEVVYAGQTGSFLDSRGMQYIQHLLRTPNPPRPISALELTKQDVSVESIEHSFDVVLDDEAKEDYRRRLDDIEDQLEEARRNSDQAVAPLEAEKDRLLSELRAATGIGNKSRSIGPATPARKASHAVRQALQRAYIRMEGQLPKLVSHLKEAIQIERNAFAYRSDTPGPTWEL